MKMPEDDTGCVESMIKWIYARRMETPALDTEKEGKDYLWHLVDLNSFADKYQIAHLKGQISNEVDKVYESWRSQSMTPPDLDLVKHLYEHSTKTSFLRKLFVAWYAFSSLASWTRKLKCRDSLIALPGFAADLAMALAAKSTGNLDANHLQLSETALDLERGYAEDGAIEVYDDGKEDNDDGEDGEKDEGENDVNERDTSDSGCYSSSAAA